MSLAGASLVCLFAFFSSINVLHAQALVEEIPKDWTASGLRQVRAISARASSTFGEVEGDYAPAKVMDRNGRTKWVASIKPSIQAPQWIELRFAGEQTISCVAVFGEAVTNDGIVDAQVAVRRLDGAEFSPIATVKDAQSPSWRAVFPSVKTTALRLLITRSKGPSTHTDVYEIEAYGPRLGARELGEYVKSNVAGLSERLKNIGEQSQAWLTNSWFDKLQRDYTELTAATGDATGRVQKWNELSAAAQEDLSAVVDGLMENTEHFKEQIEGITANLPALLKISRARATELQSAREFAARAGADEKVRLARDGNDVRLFNRQLLLRLNETSGYWDAVWMRKADASVRKAGFSVEYDGRTTGPNAAKTKVETFTDKLGGGQEIVQRWGDQVKIERHIRLYDGKAILTVSGSISNSGTSEIAMGTARLLEISSEASGQWHLGSPLEAPAGVYIGGFSDLLCDPPRGGALKMERSYESTGLLALAGREPSSGLVFGYLSAFEARPELSAKFRTWDGGTALSAHQRFIGRKLGAGESVELDTLYVAANADPYAALEQYGDAAALFAQQPVRRKATALWCSWYAHRMAMTEDLVLANATVAARHFQPLGLEIIQLDHGWQRGDVTGDWVPNERFRHGLKWLADELKSRHGLRLGVWIAPTDVAETSETFHKHRDWLLTDGHGDPAVNWRWYWKPNPNCYELDATQADAADWIAKTFAQLTAWGVSYYKIDFIAASGGEHFIQHNPKSTRGWTPLRRAMESVRRGAGPEAWIRYCQPPPLLSAGLADSAYGAGDTLDAGLNGKIDVLRDSGRRLAAGYWLNDRLYHREVCDLSVRSQADVEETRLRLALMTLAGCSISFSDELQYLPPSRIRMMQQCLPPGAPPMKPLDLFERAFPSIWHVHCRQAAEEWEVVGLFNFENQPEQRTVDFNALGLPADVKQMVFEFWEEKFVGIHQGRITLTLPPQTSRVLSIRRLTNRPQLIATDMHLFQGFHELKQQAWDEKSSQLSGEYERMPGLDSKAFFYVPASYEPRFEFPLTKKSARLTNVGNGIWMQEIHFDAARMAWSIPFQKSASETPRQL